MKKFTINRLHNLDDEACFELAEELMTQLVDRYGGRVHSDQCQFSYKHPTGVKATVIPQAEELTVEVTTSLMTRSFAPQIEAAIHKVLDKHIDSD